MSRSTDSRWRHYLRPKIVDRATEHRFGTSASVRSHFGSSHLAQAILICKRVFRAVLVGPHAEKNPTSQISKAYGEMLNALRAFRLSQLTF